ncbi:hypothetical protein ACNJNU_25115 [Citrobacter freundii]|uniref:hypothetical protein n=1 Tax=Citrobacter freundii TaxID=546 RepID=UPI003A842ED9
MFDYFNRPFDTFDWALIIDAESFLSGTLSGKSSSAMKAVGKLIMKRRLQS